MGMTATWEANPEIPQLWNMRGNSRIKLKNGRLIDMVTGAAWGGELLRQDEAQNSHDMSSCCPIFLIWAKKGRLKELLFGKSQQVWTNGCASEPLWVAFWGDKTTIIQSI